MEPYPPPSPPANQSPVFYPPGRRSSLFPTLDFSEPIPPSAGKPPLPDEPFQSSLSRRKNERKEKGTKGTRETESKSKMADPFEVRMRFTNQLQHLNASVTSAQKAANYALKYRDMDEDLHSCILEQLERVSSWFFDFLSPPQARVLTSTIEFRCDITDGVPI